MKGWTVRTEATKGGSKGVAGRDVYMMNAEHVNHRNTERIVPIFGNDRTMSNISYAGESYAAKQAANGKGGRPPSSYAIEFTLNLPKGYRPDDEQWRKIVVHCLRETAKQCGVEPKQIGATSRAVLHQQRQDGQGTGDHVHLVIGKFTQDGQYLRDLQRKTVTARMKQSFNNAVKHCCGYDWTEYAKTLQEQKYPNKRPVPTWKVRAAREADGIRAQQAELDKRARFLEERTKELGIVQDDLDDQFNNDMAVKRLVGNFSRQSEKLLKSLKEHDVKQVRRQANRIHSTINELGAFNVSDDDQDWIDKMTTAINEHEGIESQKIPAISEVRAKHRMKM